MLQVGFLSAPSTLGDVLTDYLQRLEKSLVFRYQAISTSYYTGAYYVLVAGRLVYFGQSNVQSRLWLCLVLIDYALYQVRTPGGGDRRCNRLSPRRFLRGKGTKPNL